MSSLGREADLDIHDDERFQRREWIAQRVAWMCFAATLLAAALGLFGSGPLSRDSVSAEGLRVEYERFTRRQRAAEVVVRVDRPPGESLVIDFTGSYLDRSSLERISPEPSRESALPDGTRFVFASTPGEAAEVRFRIESEAVGTRAAALRVNGASVSFSTFVFP